jgi:hypothetical protein
MGLFLPACQSAINNDWKKWGPAPEVDYDATRAAGESAESLLTHRYFKRVVVEIQSVKGYSPTQETLNRLQTFLEQTLHPPRGASIFVDESVPAGTSERWSIVDLRALEAKYRNRYPSKDELAVHIFFLDGANQDDQPAYRTFGQAYFNTSIVLYSRTLRAQAALTPAIPSYILETSILEHEFGHLLGLVRGVHADPDHPQHCSEPRCLMNWLVEAPGAPLTEQKRPETIRDEEYF